jgi:hypothetical protein
MRSNFPSYEQEHKFAPGHLCTANQSSGRLYADNLERRDRSIAEVGRKHGLLITCFPKYQGSEVLFRGTITSPQNFNGRSLSSTANHVR